MPGEQQQNNYYRIAAIVLTVIAGAWTLFHLIWNLANQTNDDFWGQALLVLTILAIILAFLQYFSERTALLATVSPNERFPDPTISRFFFASAGSAPLWFVLRMYVGSEWFLAGWDKVKDPTWGTSGVALTGFIKGALAKATGEHASVQGWYANFLQHFVLPNAGFFSFLVTWGEVAVGVGLLVGALTGIAAGFGVLMNFNYLLAGTVSINPILGMFGLFLVVSWRVCGWIGVDRWLLPALGLPWKPGTMFQQHEESSSTGTPAHA
jgi:thiosulfate dehydrogenase [quinone] large subunit